MPSGGGWVGAGEVISAEELVREVWGPQYKEEIGLSAIPLALLLRGLTFGQRNRDKRSSE